MRRPLLTIAQRQILLTLATAALGLATAASLYPVWLRPARPGQMPGYLAAANVDAHAPMLFLVSTIVLTIGAALLLRPVVTRMTAPDTRAWARHAAIAACVTALWHATVNRNVFWTVIPALIAIGVAMLLRRTDARFSRADVILLPTVAAVFFALCDITELNVEHAIIIAAGSVFAVRLLLVFIRRGIALPASLCFAAAPLALLAESHFLGRAQRHDGWPALAIALLTPIVLRLALRNAPATRSRVRRAIAFVVFPLAVYGYTSATSLATAEGKPRSDFFEEAQHLAPASEILKGEKPYRDIIPPHGLIQDGLLDVAILHGQPVTIGRILKTRGTIVAGASIATYAIAAAATGSPHAGLVAFFVSAFMGYPTGSVRFLPWMITVAFAAGAARKRNTRLLAAAGAFAALAALTSIDFGFYAILALTVVIVRFGPDARSRLRALRAAAIGLAMVSIPAFIAMLAAGWFVDFFRVTLFEIATLGPVYTLPPFSAPPALYRQFPEVLAALFDRGSTMYVIWFSTLIAASVALSRLRVQTTRRARRVEGILTVAVCVVIAGISYAERHHLYFSLLVPPLLTAAAWLLFRARSSSARLTGWALAVSIALLAGFTSHIAITGWLRRSHGPVDPGWVEVGLPRAQGAYFREPDVRTLDSVKRYVEQHLRPEETFFDFTNRPMLYFLLDRSIPIRQLEPAFYETPERQREVIAYLELNPHVRLAIVPPDVNDETGIDLVPNRERAPLVWQYLLDHFEPDFQEGAVAIWKRRAPPSS